MSFPDNTAKVEGQCIGSALIAEGITVDYQSMVIDPNAFYDYEHIVGKPITMVWRTGLNKPKAGKQLEIPQV